MPPENVKTGSKSLLVTLLLTLLELKHVNFRNMELLRNRPGARSFHITIFHCNSKYLLNTYDMPGLMPYMCLLSHLILTVMKHILCYSVLQMRKPRLTEAGDLLKTTQLINDRSKTGTWSV